MIFYFFSLRRWSLVSRLQDLDLVMSDVERKGGKPNLDQAYGNGLATTAQGQYDSAEDVFGNEEGAQVMSPSHHLVSCFDTS